MVTTNNDRKISKESNTDNFDTCKIKLKQDMTSNINESIRRSRVGSKILCLENLEIELNHNIVKNK